MTASFLAIKNEPILLVMISGVISKIDKSLLIFMDLNAKLFTPDGFTRTLHKISSSLILC